MKSKTNSVRTDSDERGAEAAKTSRLRALRLTKEAADKEAERLEAERRRATKGRLRPRKEAPASV